MTKELEITTIEKAPYGGFSQPKTTVIKNKSEWRELFGDTKEVPAVNFRKQLIVAAFMGMQRSGGFSIEVARAVEINGEIVVGIKKKTPKGMVTMAFTQPYHIAAMPKTKLPVRIVDIEKLDEMAPDEAARKASAAQPIMNFIVALETDRVREGDRQALAAAGAKAIADFRSQLNCWLKAKQLEEKCKVVDELTHLAIVLIQTTGEIATQIKLLKGVDTVVEDGPAEPRSSGLIR